MQGEEINKVSWLLIFLACNGGVLGWERGRRRVKGGRLFLSFISFADKSLTSFG